MPHLHLNIYNGHGDTIDEEGADFADLPAAEAAAYAGIRSLLSAKVLEGEMNLKGRCEIVDHDGHLLTAIPFADVIRIIGN